MIKYTYIYISFVLLAFTLVVPNHSIAQDSNSSERFFGYLDKNKDGKLDTDEVRRMPGSVREAFANADFSVDRGISKEDFIREMPRIMEQMRKKRDEERENRDKDSKKPEPKREEPRREDPKKSAKGATYSPKKRPKITVNIPSQFADGDSDQDGQIGLYEWRQWKPAEKYHFPVYDINKDGFLTPRELSNPPNKEEIDGYLASIGAPPTAAASVPATPNKAAPASSNPKAPVAYDKLEKQPKKELKRATQQPEKIEEKDPLTKTAQLFFQQMDSDKNGSLTPDEWARSRRLKPKFEEAGIDINGAMNVEQFTTAYRKIYGDS
ncbi:MAG: EF-hand domain-containing protein [Planctomycetaceae bacterium]|nr:EF-hand domain-containing protein [Planctomycetaceae bacterium]MDB4786493.1 EF-hand domain-containing protein [Planctomycetaceae bacterium]MDG2391590.1 EF-hand domain-containing protein [Planctomycetaceae bacterium]